MALSGCRYIFDRGVCFAEVCDTLHLALLAVTSMHGETRVRLECAFECDERAHAVVIDATLAVGRQLNTIFSGFVAREFGDDALVIQRPPGHANPQAIAKAS
ncbi:hypothetical protein ACERK3_07105 [Phycisphaerales bacterium AB-hyl4]|uniref:Uncharacterized protein n=1 Tax=Natronomicrosphaera hydrolytica TaxID=3242702 RepID=A0ABV4U3A1_9BACT